MKGKKQKTIAGLSPRMRFKIPRSKNPDDYTLLVKYRRKGMSVRNERILEKLQFSGSLRISNVRNPRNT